MPQPRALGLPYAQDKALCCPPREPLPGWSRSPAPHGHSLCGCSVSAVAPALPAALPTLGSASEEHLVSDSIATKSALISSSVPV